jgi:hypothetical protein
MRRVNRGRAAGFPFLLIVLGLAATACGRTYFGEPLDPTAADVVPAAGVDAAVLETGAPADSMTPGIEGAVLFVRLVDQQQRLILDRPFQWPSDRQPIPPGAYHLTAYWRGCDGNCGNLSAEAPPFCVADVVAAPRGRVAVEITPRSLAPGTTCTVSAQ